MGVCIQMLFNLNNLENEKLYGTFIIKLRGGKSQSLNCDMAQNTYTKDNMVLAAIILSKKVPQIITLKQSVNC